MSAVPNMAVFCSSLTSCFPGMLLTYFLNVFEIVPVAPIITGITFVFTFHMRCISLDLLIIIIIITIIINEALLLTQYCAGGKIEKNEMGGACGAYGGGERCAQGSSGET